MGEYAGLDVSKEETAFCVKSEDVVTLARGKVSTDPAALFEALREHCRCPERIVLETGTLSGWLAGARTGQAGDAREGDRRAPGARGAEVAAQQDRCGRCGASGRSRADRVLPCGFGEQRGGAGGADSAQGARSSGRAVIWCVSGVLRRTRSGVFLGSLGIRFPKGSGKLGARASWGRGSARPWKPGPS